MKKILFVCVAVLLAGSIARAQKYEIVMKLDNVETLRFRPDSVERHRGIASQLSLCFWQDMSYFSFSFASSVK
ncbi:MAG: hypothetical protein LBL58_14675 [Tannerellaceae bacterium]|jgi:hypothetical protein|nr:hypothetical protein [Tannerellaceae bacterium]